MGKNEILVKINKRYVVNIIYYVQIPIQLGFNTVIKNERNIRKIEFTGGDIGSSNDITPSLKCRSNFILEKNILAGIQAKL